MRRRAAIELLPEADDPVVVAQVLGEARVESDHGALRAMLRLLGASGALEALGLIQLHARSPASDLRSEGRAALKIWLRVNGAPEAHDELPEPPHAFYDPPPPFAPDRPAGHSLPARMSYPPGTLPPGPTLPPPYYEAPPDDGVPPGFRFERSPRRGLVVAGAVTFGGAYSAVASIPTVETFNGNMGETAWFAVPVAGPWVLSARLFEARGDFAGLSHLSGGLLIVDGLVQLAGLTMLTVGLAHPNWRLAPSFAPTLGIGATGSALRWSY